jgi:hypothetical protein
MIDLGANFKEGCRELVRINGGLINPSMVRLPDGDILVFARYPEYEGSSCYVARLNELLSQDSNPQVWSQISFNSDNPNVEDVRPFIRSGLLYLIGAKPQPSGTFGISVYSLDMIEKRATEIFEFRELGDNSNKNWTTPLSGESEGHTMIVSYPNNIRGGSNLIPFGKGFISIAHKMYWSPGFGEQYNPKDGKQYSHVLLSYSNDLLVTGISKEFTLASSNIEFAAGLVEDEGSYLVSYGIEDKEFAIARVDKSVLLDIMEEK